MSIIICFIKGVFKLILIGLGALAAMVLALVIWANLVPTDSVRFELPTLAAKIKIRRWSAVFEDGSFDMVVSTSNGSTTAYLFPNWSVFGRASLYSTPKGDLVALGDGTYETFVTFPENESPFEIFQPPYSGPDSEAWTYLGAIDVNKQDKLEFFSPLHQRECYAMLGAGESPFRKKHQVEHFCENP